MLGIKGWIARLNWLAQHPEERAKRRAECWLLGHEQSGERLMTLDPIHICLHCADMFHVEQWDKR